MHRRRGNKGALAVAFGAGFLLACCPSSFTIAVLAIAVIVLGISVLQC